MVGVAAGSDGSITIAGVAWVSGAGPVDCVESSSAVWESIVGVLSPFDRVGSGCGAVLVAQAAVMDADRVNNATLKQKDFAACRHFCRFMFFQT
jgi:hypothetical protein